VQYDQFGTIIEEWFDRDSRCQLCNAFHHIFLGEHLHAVGDHLVVAAPGTCFFHYLIADQRHCFRIVELNAPCTSLAGEFSKCENGEAILFFGCQFHKSILQNLSHLRCHMIEKVWRNHFLHVVKVSLIERFVKESTKESLVLCVEVRCVS
jgi:hypothetical protein